MIELYDIGPNPRVREILVEYLPKEKDLFPAGSISIAQDAAISISERLEKLGLQVELKTDVSGPK